MQYRYVYNLWRQYDVRYLFDYYIIYDRKDL